jgi:hypothetical protein
MGVENMNPKWIETDPEIKKQYESMKENKPFVDKYPTLQAFCDDITPEHLKAKAEPKKEETKKEEEKQ